VIRFYLAGVCLLILGIFILNTQGHQDPNLHSPLVSERMTGVTAQRFDEEGRLVQVLKMQSWEQRKASAMSHITLPHLTIYAADGSEWEISAQQGDSTQKGKQGSLEKLDLRDSVTITRRTLEPWLTLKTESLIFLPQESRAFTEAPVMLEGPGMQTHAIGMRASLRHHGLELLRAVQTSYLPHAPSHH